MDWHSIDLADIGRLNDAITSVVEHRSDYGRVNPDWDLILSEIEESESGLDLGSDLLSPVVKEIMKRARKVYREMRDS